MSCFSTQRRTPGFAGAHILESRELGAPGFEGLQIDLGADDSLAAPGVGQNVAVRIHNQAAAGAESALSCMMARTASYTGREVTWEETLHSKEVWDAHLDLNKLVAK